jgi:hypothetical protein
MARALAVVAVGQKRFVFGEDMARIGDERQPDCRFRYRVPQTRRIHRVIDHRFEFV